MVKEKLNNLKIDKDKIKNKIKEIESYCLSNQEDEDRYIKELNILYNKLNK